jgi:ankyrin repeat protein
MATSNGSSILYTLLGLNRAGRILYGLVFALAVPALVAWFVVLPRMRFSDLDEQLFRAARHGDQPGVERALEAGADVNAQAPVDRKTALFRAAIFGHARVVRLLLERGADANARGSDGRSALEITTDARAHEKNPAAVRALDDVAAALREPKPQP